MKRITIITGHYGSGKTEFSINLALKKKPDMLIDLDIVNPYFRSREVKDLLEKEGIQTIGSTLKSSLGSDLPYVSGEMYVPFRNKEISAIIDLGGNDVGATLIRQFVDEIKTDEVDLLSVVNVYRPETACVSDIIKMIKSIEGKGGLKVTGLVNNSNLLSLTKTEDVLASYDVLREVEKQLSIPVLYTTVHKNLLPIESYSSSDEQVPINLFLRKDWMK
ncbi:MAG: ATP-binding protein [Treponema sp.]|nr:MAG: ATP-binding protein [Treponema sp.]